MDGIDTIKINNLDSIITKVINVKNNNTLTSHNRINKYLQRGFKFNI